MPKLFLKRTEIRQRKTANSSISTTPLKFEDVAARNAFEYLWRNYNARNCGIWHFCRWEYGCTFISFHVIMLQSRTLRI